MGVGGVLPSVRSFRPPSPSVRPSVRPVRPSARSFRPVLPPGPSARSVRPVLPSFRPSARSVLRPGPSFRPVRPSARSFRPVRPPGPSARSVRPVLPWWVRGGVAESDHWSNAVGLRDEDRFGGSEFRGTRVEGGRTKGGRLLTEIHHCITSSLHNFLGNSSAPSVNGLEQTYSVRDRDTTMHRVGSLILGDHVIHTHIMFSTPAPCPCTNSNSNNRSLRYVEIYTKGTDSNQNQRICPHV